jgi:aminopeptidase N
MRRIPRSWLGLAVGILSLVVFEQSVFGQRASRRQPPAAGQQPAAAAPAAPAAQAPGNPPAAVEPLRTPSDRTVHIHDIRLDLRIDLKGKAVDGKATLQFSTVRPTRTVSLDASNFEIKEIRLVEGSKATAPLKHSYDGKKLVIDLGSRWPAGQAGTVSVEYRLQDPKDGLHFFGPTKSDPEAPLTLWSQGEPISNRNWIPCIDEPSERQTTEIVATVPEGFEVLSNGKLIDRKENPAAKTVTFDWRQDQPHPAYLVTLVVGQFDVVREEWEGKPVLYYVPKGRKAEVAPTYGRTRDMITFFSQRFGVPYPWAKYAQVNAYQFGGGMENTSATTMGEGILRDERSLLDGSSESIVSHELAHQWWGDMVTCRDWSHLWLNEGFASYAEALWDEHSKGADEYAYNMYQKAGGAIAGGKTRPVNDRRYPTPDSMFDARSYPKGAWVLHMLRNRLGEEPFWKGIQRYGKLNQFQSAETADFRFAMERTTGRDLERFFYDWLERPGSPELEITTEYLPDSQTAKIAIKQAQAAEPFQFPLKLVLHCSGASQPTVVEEQMTDKELNLRIPLPGTLLRVDVDPDQAVLASIKETKSRDLWRAQLLESPSIPARIRATQYFAKNKTDEDRALLAQAFTKETFWGVKTELASALGDAGGDLSRDALLTGLKDSNARVRRACVTSLGKFPGDTKVSAAMKEIMTAGDPSYAVQNAALNSYAKLGQKDAVALITPWLAKPSYGDAYQRGALTALGSTEDPSTLETLLEWTAPGKPRTSRMAAQGALALLAKSKRLTDAQRQKILKNFLAVLEGDNRFQRFGVLQALPDLGPAASSALPALDKIVRDSPEGRMRDMVKGVADKIRALPNSGAATAASTELSQLREQLKRLEQSQEELRKRLDRYEKAARAQKG